MKADVRSTREKEALEWATQFFRNCKDRLSKTGSMNASRAIATDMMSYVWDGSEEAAAAVVKLNKEIPALPEFAAALIEDGKPLPKSLREFVAALLRRPNKRVQARRGPKQTGISRDLDIGAAVGFVATRWEFVETRRRDQKSGRPCAASIVRDALALGANVHFSEDKVVKSYRKFCRICHVLPPPDGCWLFGNGQLSLRKDRGQLIICGGHSASDELAQIKSDT